MCHRYLERRAQRRFVLAAVATAALVYASEPWSKDYRKWSADDVQRVLTDSPWAQQGRAAMRAPADNDERTVTPPPGASPPGTSPTITSSSRGVSDGKWDGGVSRNIDDTTPTLPVSIRWESALPVREALSRMPGAHSQEALEESQQDYVISVKGLLTNEQSKRQAQTGDAQAVNAERSSSSAPEQMNKELVGVAKLVPRSRPAIRAERVKIDPSSSTIEVFFPRTMRIAEKDKEVTFELQFGSMTVVKKFRLKDMMYQGRLEL